MSKSKVMIFSLGGTIAMKRDASGGVTPALDATDLIDAVPDLANEFNIDCKAFRKLASVNLVMDDILALAHEIEATLDAGYDGVVVTQGTDTLSETAFTLDLVLRQKKPVVITGAMRHPEMPSPDGPANLLAACRVAASRTAHNMGVLAVANDTIHAARYVIKGHTSDVAAFISPNAGPVGRVMEGRTVITTRLSRQQHIGFDQNARHCPVCILSIAGTDDLAMLKAVENTGYQGLVIEGQGAGHVPAVMMPDLKVLAEHMPTVFTSRVSAGEILRTTYGYEGAEIDLIKAGLLPGGMLNATKARILLSLLLRNGADRVAIRSSFKALYSPLPAD